MSDIKAPRKPKGYIERAKDWNRERLERSRKNYAAKLERDTERYGMEAKMYKAQAEKERALGQVRKARPVSSGGGLGMGLGGGGDLFGSMFGPAPKSSVQQPRSAPKRRRVVRRKKGGRKKKGKSITINYV